MIRALPLIVLVCLLWVASSGKAEPKEKDAAAKDLAKLQGKWKNVEIDSDGKVNKGFKNGLIIAFEKNERIDYDAEGGVESRVSIKLDPSKSPNEMDQTYVFERLFPDEKGKTYLGIYQLEGDELKIAMAIAPWNGERPKEFTTKERSHFAVATYKRVK